MQALENVAGVNQVSEGQAAVPAIRGLARGRTLILIDGARVSSERRVGPSATYLDPTRRSKASSGARPGLGRLRIRRLRRRRSRCARGASRRARRSAAQFRGTLGAGVPERRGALEMSKGFAAAACSLAGAHARRRRLGQPGGRGLQLGLRGPRLPGPRRAPAGPACSRPAGRATSGATSSGRATTRGPSGSTTRRRTRIASPRLRSRATSAGFQRVGVTGFVGTLRAASPIRIASRRRRPAAASSAPTSRAKDFHVRGFGERLLGRRGSKSASTSTAASACTPLDI